MTARIPTIVLGGTGYVAGELLRLIAGHPQFELAAVMSDSQPGESVIKAFPHLASAYADTRFKSQAEVEKVLAETPEAAMFSAAPHGVSAALIDSLLGVATRAGTRPRVVDISADFRYSSADAYEAVYKHPHGAPKRIAEFTCAVPEHLKKLDTTHVAHPGCFATATLLASVPLLSLGVTSPTLFLVLQAAPAPAASRLRGPITLSGTATSIPTTHSRIVTHPKSAPVPRLLPVLKLISHSFPTRVRLRAVYMSPCRRP
jgi:N-acetyl-gamma-glutamylphosphate reductase